MRPAEIANQEIIDAGKKLQSTGKNITGYGLRRILGAGDAKRLKSVWDELSMAINFDPLLANKIDPLAYR